MKSLIALIFASLLLPALVSAQPAPPPPNGPPGDQAGPGGGGDQQGTQERMHQRREQEQNGGGPNNNGGPPPGPNGPMRQYEMMKGYLDLVDRYAAVSRDPTTAGIAAVVAPADTLKPRGPDAAIEYFSKLLPDVKNESIARAIRAQLADLYKVSGQQDKALEQLKTLIVTPTNDSQPAH